MNCWPIKGFLDVGAELSASEHMKRWEGMHLVGKHRSRGTMMMYFQTLEY